MAAWHRARLVLIACLSSGFLWAALIKRAFEIDPLLCPKCGGTKPQNPTIINFPLDVVALPAYFSLTTEKAISYHCTWFSGRGWRQPIKAVGRQRVRLAAGAHQLIVRFEGVRTPHTHFGGFEFTKTK